MNKTRPLDVLLTPKRPVHLRTPTTRTLNYSPFGDRFIPNRSVNNFETSHHLMTSPSSTRSPSNGNTDKSTRRLFLEAYDSQAQNKVLSFSCKPMSRSDKEKLYERELSLKYHTAFNSQSRRNATRTLPEVPELMLDVPALRDDFYLNLIDWSKTNEHIAIGIDDKVYIWNPNTKMATTLPDINVNMTRGDNETEQNSHSFVTSVKWMPNRNDTLAVAKSDNTIYLWNVEMERCVDQIRDHECRVASLSWNEWVLTSGSFKGLILNHDVRCTKRGNKLSEWSFHRDDVCGLSWSNDGRLLAAGSDDKIVSLWDKSKISSNSREPLFRLVDHKAAIKALAWCPWSACILATAGGKQDGTIKLWNSFSGTLTKSIDTQSQVSGLVWSSLNKELLSSHGEPDHRLSIWKFPSLSKVGDILGHVDRVLSVVLAPNGQRVASLGADETLRFWDCFKCPLLNSNRINSTPVASCLNLNGIR